MGAYTGGDDGEEYCLSQVQVAGAALSFKKRSARAPISSVAAWGHAWNVFYEATLHHHPSMHYQLFCYNKHIMDYATKYKFSFLMAYDQTHRIQIAAQRHLPPSVQSASWTKHSTALFNTYLRDNGKSQCTKCFGFDHYTKNCPKTSVNSNLQPNQFQPPSTQQFWHM